MMAPHSICAISAAPFPLSYLLLQLSISDYVQHILESLQDHKLISFPLFSHHLDCFYLPLTHHIYYHIIILAPSLNNPQFLS